ncbi:hypothetical protein ACHAPT_008836 [Fusarium lateritium]
MAAPSNTKINWGKCNLDWGNATEAAIYGDVECATIKAPLDYTNAGNGKTVDLQLARVKAKKQPAKGSIFYNPGGPGASAVESLVTGTSDYFTVLGGAYNLIAVDPRGTGRTLPFNCSTEDTKPANAKRWDVLPQADLWPTLRDQSWKELGEKADRCYEARKSTGAFIGTAFSARDIMTVVDALGEDGKLRYWGVSYGTVLGQTLAGMFPDRIDRMVLDGNVMIDEYVMGLNPSITHDTERAFLGVISECVKAGPELCKLAEYHGSNTTAESLTIAIEDLWEELKNTKEIPKEWGLPEDEYFQGGTSLLSSLKGTIQQFLYGARNFPTLIDLVEKMLDGDWKGVKEILDQPGDEEHWNWGGDALNGIYCGDQAYRAETVDDYYSAWALHTEMSSFSDVGFINSEYACARWRFKAAETIDMNKFKHVNTNVPILLVNSRYDPVTPLVSAYEISTRFNGSRVLVHEGFGHGVSGHPSLCTYTAIVDYFVNARMPRAGTHCPPSYPIFQYLQKVEEAKQNQTESEG